MTTVDYAPLLEKIRAKISSWTAGALSYAGRLTLINSVIVSLSNFWISAYRLPAGCIKEIDKLCAAFLWSGPDLNPKKAKIAWTEICKPKQEGGLGIKSLAEANTVSCLKLIWRIVPVQSSLWVTWIWKNLIRKGSFWSVKDNSHAGSWMWKKLLKYREVAREMHKVDVNNGHYTSFWYDNWSPMGRLIDVTGPRGVIDMGIPLDATVEKVLQSQRTRKHRVDNLNQIEAAIRDLYQRTRVVEGKDIPLWQSSGAKFSKTFTTKHTWNNIRHLHPRVEWYKGVWFPFSTPKYSFFLWLAIHNRLATGDRIKQWNSGQRVDCVLCDNTEESRDHLFFSCPYAAAIWKALAQRLLHVNYSTDWTQLVALLNNTTIPRLNLFLFSAEDKALELSGSYFEGWKIVYVLGNYSDYVSDDDEVDEHHEYDDDGDDDEEEVEEARQVGPEENIIVGSVFPTNVKHKKRVEHRTHLRNTTGLYFHHYGWNIKAAYMLPICSSAHSHPCT
ncbi:Reverse transcriptase zinc-binding domain [Arabidopsis thaliana x Arabidopsis arenosa]|uniref:Reverse transcriptase zinc-binding domain n=1 Tax=Arabidopsis thaliana x Arabidopsis arenosa TaxID=1240361 RepID=A0A8T2C9U4_9BRAS|nr:Reverse transcriptase zinc-binding domain [Arabidopsis thaliana x Arabidopsis arenosa]